jgi:hypothetical protein
MTCRHGACRGLAAAVAGTAVLTLLLGCSAGGDSTTPAAEDAAWTVGRTPDGQPDLQGVWINYESTPFEAPDPSRAREGGEGGRGRGGEGTGGAPIFGRATQRRAGPARRSMVVDPPSGLVPVMPWAEKKRADDIAAINDSWVHQSTWERCITRGPSAMFPTNADSAYEILQTPGLVTIVYEIMSTPRFIPVDGSPHLPSNVRFWMGDSRGRWEGETLVVDVTNYTDKGSIATNAAAQRIRGIPNSEELHLVERFTRTSADTIQYEVTIEDPKVFTTPWKVAGPLSREDEYRMFESACHEGNQAYMETTLKGRSPR